MTLYCSRDRSSVRVGFSVWIKLELGIVLDFVGIRIRFGVGFGVGFGDGFGVVKVIIKM